MAKTKTTKKPKKVVHEAEPEPELDPEGPTDQGQIEPEEQNEMETEPVVEETPKEKTKKKAISKEIIDEDYIPDLEEPEDLPIEEEENDEEEIVKGKDKSKGKTKRIAANVRAGIVFPVGRIHKNLKKRAPKDQSRAGVGPAVYMGAVLEYLCAEVLELSGAKTREWGMNTINPRAMKVAIDEDRELKQLTRDCDMSGGGVSLTHSKFKRSPAKKAKRGIKKVKAIKSKRTHEKKGGETIV